jgi:hypothetical protein
MDDDVMEDVMLKREAATEFLQPRDRRSLYEECYKECCSWEEVREHYEKDRTTAVRLTSAFRPLKVAPSKQD